MDIEEIRRLENLPPNMKIKQNSSDEGDE